MAVKRPDHDAAMVERVPSKIIATWPVGTFVENIVARDDGSLIVSIVTSHELALVRPGDEPRRFAVIPGPPTGLSLVGNELFVNVGEPGQAGWSIVRVSAYGQVAKVLDVPDARFLNGSAVFRGSLLIVVDSILGRAFLVDTRSGEYSVWLDDELLRKSTGEPMMPGVNGVKVFHGHVYFTSTERSLILRAPALREGFPGKLEVLAERFVGDDFALDIDGNLYVTTHVHNQLQRLAPDGTRTVLAGAEDGLHGSTAAAFGRTHEDRRALYVTTTGGIVAPIDGVVREAKLVRLEVGVEGAALTGL
jgi:hypothetical protein